MADVASLAVLRMADGGGQQMADVCQLADTICAPVGACTDSAVVRHHMGLVREEEDELSGVRWRCWNPIRG